MLDDGAAAHMAPGPEPDDADRRRRPRAASSGRESESRPLSLGQPRSRGARQVVRISYFT